MGATGPSHASVATRQVSEEPGALRNALADNRRAILKFPEAQAIRAHVCSGILFPLQVGVGTCMAGSPPLPGFSDRGKRVLLLLGKTRVRNMLA